MPDSTRPGSLGFEFTFQKPSGMTPIDEDAPFRLVILGNFSGRAVGAGGSHSISPVAVDADNFASACGQFGASVRVASLSKEGLEVDIPLRKLEDFHPDELLKTVPPLGHLAALRARLLSPSSADAAAAELREIFGAAPAASATRPASQISAESGEDAFARLLGNPNPAVSAAAASGPSAPASMVERLLKQAVSNSATPKASGEQTQLLALLEAELTARLRKLLHDPVFQEVEAAWRGLDMVVHESNDAVKLSVIDISREELDRQLASAESPVASAVGRQIEQMAPNAILGAYCFASSDAGALLKIARLAAVCGTAFIGGAAPDLVGCASFGSQPNPLDWGKAVAGDLSSFAELRRMPEAAHIGLAAPRYLARQPYGKGSDAIQTFPFEELPADHPHESYLWANPAFLCGRRLVDAFAEDAWEMELGGVGGEIGGLPVHAFAVAGGKEVKPCAEAWLSEKAADAILSHGLMPVLSVKGRDSVILVSLRSIASPAAPLAFRHG